MPGRQYTAPDSKYRFGFNGKEKDDEGMGGGGSTYDYGFRIYNPQIAKFLSVDPLTKSFSAYTPYQYAANTPISAIDLDGAEAEIVIYSHYYIEEFNCALQNGDAGRVQELYNTVLTDNAKDQWQESFFRKNGGEQGKPSTFNICEAENPYNYVDIVDHTGKHLGRINYGDDGTGTITNSDGESVVFVTPLIKVEGKGSADGVSGGVWKQTIQDLKDIVNSLLDGGFKEGETNYEDVGINPQFEGGPDKKDPTDGNESEDVFKNKTESNSSANDEKTSSTPMKTPDSVEVTSLTYKGIKGELDSFEIRKAPANSKGERSQGETILLEKYTKPAK